ncbi:MAG: cytochrome c biogenesis protein CcdA [Spirochaetaceae bacterium]|nr:cytochrome c biogenesis protein CcdA [Spirochaetaceae bacterium]
METNISILTAFAAGLLSFASPCVLPLLSGYLAFISGARSGDAGDGGEENGTAGAAKLFSRRQLSVVVSTLFFVLGFGVVFVLLSVIVYGFIVFLGGVNNVLNIIAGSLIIVLGLNILFNFIPFLKYDDKSAACETCTPEHSILAVKEDSFLHPARRPRGLPGSFLAGLAFGAGWTPCVGAFLGSILLMASQSGRLALSALYLAVYAAGLGVPFLIAAFFWNALMDQVRKARRLLPVIRIISGVFLVAAGLLMAFGRFFLLNSFFQMNAYRLSVWAQSGSPAVRLVPALIFLAFSALPFIIALIRRKRPLAPLPVICSLVFLFLAGASAAGIINCADYLSRWLGYSGI